MQSNSDLDKAFTAYYDHLWNNGATHFQAEYCAEVLTEQSFHGTPPSAEDQAVLASASSSLTPDAAGTFEEYITVITDDSRPQSIAGDANDGEYIWIITD